MLSADSNVCFRLFLAGRRAAQTLTSFSQDTRHHLNAFLRDPIGLVYGDAPSIKLVYNMWVTLNSLFSPHPVSDSFASLWHIYIGCNKPHSLLIEFKIGHGFANILSLRHVCAHNTFVLAIVVAFSSDFFLASFSWRFARHVDKFKITPK